MGGIASGDKTFQNYSIRPNDLVQVIREFFMILRGERVCDLYCQKGGVGYRGAGVRGC
jgi:tRNA/tmRNA/rRNA uracil-C5-methylase (TrmA/RlmC/RlmD family)